MPEIQITKKIIDNSLGVVITDPSVFEDKPGDEFPFTRAEKIKLRDLTQGGGTSSGSTAPISITYSELYDIYSNGDGFSIGQQYLITDYQTIHNIPNASTDPIPVDVLQVGVQYTIEVLIDGDDFTNVGFISNGVPFIATDINPNNWVYTDVYDYLYTADIEPLLVTASGQYSLKPETYSSLFPQDVIYYNIESDQNLMPGCTKGYINRRIDTVQNNDFPFDFRNAKFRRWQIEVTDEWSDTTTYSKNDVVIDPDNNSTIYIAIKDNFSGDTITNTDNWRMFEWENLSYVSTYSGTWQIGNINISCSGGYADYNMWSDWNNYSSSYSNKIDITGVNENNGEILRDFNNVVFGTYFCNNSIGSCFYDNSIVYNFYNNSIVYNFYNNSIGNSFYSNSIGSQFYGNSIGNDFNDMIFGDNNYNMVFGNDNHRIIFGNNNYNITFGNRNNVDITNITFGNNNVNITFGNNNSNIAFGDDNSNITFGDDNIGIEGENGDVILSGYANYILLNDLSYLYLPNITGDYTKVVKKIQNLYSLEYTDEFDDVIIINVPFVN